MNRLRTTHTLSVVLCVLCFGLVGFSQEPTDLAAELARAAQSPYDIQRFVETHGKFEWEPLWKALNITPWLPACGLNWAGHYCSSELISVATPSQAIVLLENHFSDDQVYLRFIGEGQSPGSGPWRFTGAYQPGAKYFRPEHRIVLFANKPFLAIRGQAASGSGLSTEYEAWLDLTLPDFKPVFSYGNKGHLAPFASRFGREVWGSVSALKDRPVESFTVSYHIDFTIQSDRRLLRVGNRSDTAVYTRTGSDRFTLDEKASSVTSEQIHILYGDLDSDLSNEEFLRYTFNSLKQLATGPATEERVWLEQFLTKCAETPEKQQLTEILRDPLKSRTRQ